MLAPERIVRGILDKTEVVVNGNAPWDIKVNNPGFYSRVLRQGSLGLGESYMDGWWDSPHIDQFFSLLVKNSTPWIEKINPFSLWLFIKSKLVNLAPKEKAFLIGEKHYDLGNNLFQAMLDPETMCYSCGYWRKAETLEQAQIAKLDLICRKLRLQPHQRVLDIGCGFGGFAKYAATHYGVEVVGLTVSKEQAALARERCAGLPVEIRLQDYRSINEQFDHIVSVGMFEHVGFKNYQTYMKVVKRCLKPGGLFLLHTIGSPKRGFLEPSLGPWMKKYIFPVGEIPPEQQILINTKGELEIRDWHRFGPYYDPTLMFWYKNFVVAWDEIRAEYECLFKGKFFRGWKYYLLSCAGGFRSGLMDLWQIVLAHPGEHLGYRSVR